MPNWCTPENEYIYDKNKVASQFEVSTKGIVYLQNLLDREEVSFCEMSVIATDSGEPPNIATATLKVSLSLT